jgi:hypothetical protein
LVYEKTPILPPISTSHATKIISARTPTPEASVSVTYEETPTIALLPSSIFGEGLVSSRPIIISPVPATPVIHSEVSLLSQYQPISPSPGIGEESSEGINQSQLSPALPPSLTLFIEGSEEQLYPSTMSLIMMPTVSLLQESLGTPIIGSDFVSITQKLETMIHSPASDESIYLLSLPHTLLTVDVDLITTLFPSSISLSPSLEIVQSIIEPLEQDIVSKGFSSSFMRQSETLQISPPYSMHTAFYSEGLQPSFSSEIMEVESTAMTAMLTRTVLESPSGSEASFHGTPFLLTPDITSRGSEFEETASISLLSEYSIFPSIHPPVTKTYLMFSPSPEESAYPLSPTEILIHPSSIIDQPEESPAVPFTPISESSEVVLSMIPSEEALLSASRRSDHQLVPPPFITASYPVDSLLSLSLLTMTTSLHFLPSVTTISPTVERTQAVPESISDYLISPSPSISVPEVTPKPTQTLPIATTTPSPDLCEGYCLNNAKCVYTSIQPVCICSFKFLGERCEKRRKKFYATSFTGDSFLGYGVPNESINRIVVTARFATNFPEGILLYTAVNKLYALIFIQAGHITLHFSCGEQSMHFVETRTRVDNGYNFTLEFNMELIVQRINELHCVGQINVNQSYVMRGEQTLNLHGPHESPMQMLYLGGVGSTDAVRNDELIGILSGFRGCLYSLSVGPNTEWILFFLIAYRLENYGSILSLFMNLIPFRSMKRQRTYSMMLWMEKKFQIVLHSSAQPILASVHPNVFHRNIFPFGNAFAHQGMIFQWKDFLYRAEGKVCTKLLLHFRYEGVRCQIRVCDANNPCLNGATCTFPVDDTLSNNVSYTGDSLSPASNVSSLSPVCLCPMGFSGRVCQLKINISKPSFKPSLGFDYSAFVAYEPIPRFVDWAQLKLHFVAPNTSQIALILYSGYHQGLDTALSPADQSESYSDLLRESSPDDSHFSDHFDLQSDPASRKISDFFAITFVHGYIALTWNLGSGTQRIITPSSIDRRLHHHTLFAGRSGRQAWLKVDGMRNMTGKSPGPFHRLNVNTELFVGGYETFRFEGLPHDLPLHKGFEGCIFDFGFRVKNRLYLPKATRARNVQNCYEEDC